jgi:hypothetical protein
MTRRGDHRIDGDQLAGPAARFISSELPATCECTRTLPFASAGGLGPAAALPPAQEPQMQLMRHLFRTSAVMLALLSGAGTAGAQQPSSGSNTPSGRGPAAQPPEQILVLSPAQRQAIVSGLRGEQTQSSAQGEQAQIGAKPPSAVMQQQLPDQVTSDVPQTKNLLFVKLPDRILLIDPDQQMVAQIIPIGASSDQNSGNQ